MLRKISRIIFVILFTLFVFTLASNSRVFLLKLGLIQDEILISGTGSMYPTFPKGEGKTDIMRSKETVAWPKMRRYPAGLNLLGLHFFGYTLKFGDIVDFENAKTDDISMQQYGEKAGFVKRIIGLPGDTIEVRDGFLYRNGTMLIEPYTASARSTYGGDTVSDCHPVTVPKNSLFVMGDNRKGSLDSRHKLGFISYSDVQHVLPFSEQKEYESKWRDAKNDEKSARQPTLDSSVFVDLLNAQRTSEKVKSLEYNSYLSISAKKRAEVMIRTDDFSIEATRSGYGLEKSVEEAGYDNVLYAESIARGYYDASELVDNILHFPQTKSLALSGQYQEIGLAAVVGEISHCPVQAVVVHFGGYVPPSYKSEDIAAWKQLIENLNRVIPSWEKLKGEKQVNQELLDKLLTSLYTRKSNAERILKKLQNNQWLSREEKHMVEIDNQLSTEENNLINDLNHTP